MSQVPTEADDIALNRWCQENGRYPHDDGDWQEVRELAREGAALRDVQAEKQVAGIAVLSHTLLAQVRDTLKPYQFTDDALRACYVTGLEMLDAGLPEDPILFANQLQRHAGNENLDKAFIVQLAGNVQSVAHLKYYADIVTEKAERRGWSGLSQEIQQLIGDGADADTISQRMQDFIEYRKRVQVGSGFELLTCTDLENAPEQEWLAKGLIPKGQPGAIGAPYKGMKTSICCDIAASLAVGGYVLGYFRVPRPVKVLFMSAESGLATLRATTQSICTAAGYRWPDELANLQWCTTLPKLGVNEDLRKLDAAYASFQFEVLICDPLFKMCGGDGAENMMKQADKFMHLQRWCDEHGVTLIFVHHLTKPASKVYEPAELGDLSYAGIAEHVRWWILLSRREKYTPPDPVHRLWFGCGGSAGHSGLWAVDIDLGEYIEGQPRQWNVTLQEAQEVRQEAAQKKAAQKNQEKLDAAQGKRQANVKSLLKALAKFPEGETKSTLRNLTGLNTDAISIAIGDALEAKQIEVCQVVKGGRKQGRDGYRIAKSQASGPSGPSGQKSLSVPVSQCPEHRDGTTPSIEGCPSPDACAQQPDESEQSIGTEAA